MKKSALLLTVILVILTNCNNQPENFELTPDISISIPKRYKLILNDSVKYLRSWQTSIDDDQFAIFIYTINQTGSSGNYNKKQAFKNNIEAFIQTFDFRNLDSTFIYKEDLIQSNLIFDFGDNDEKYRFFGRFISQKDNFIAICYEMPYPLDRYSRKMKDQLFASIEIK